MTLQISSGNQIYTAFSKAKEIIDNKDQIALNWIMDIIENNNRKKQLECEICASVKQLELHHVRGNKHGNEVITACYKCHYNLTVEQKRWDRSWLEPDTENNDAFLISGLIDICKLKTQKSGKEIYSLMAEKLTEGFSYD